MCEERRSNQSTMLKRHIKTTRKLEEDKFFVDCGIHVHILFSEAWLNNYSYATNFYSINFQGLPFKLNF